DPAMADMLLEEQQRTIRAAIADIRRLVYDLRPPSLDELGLLGALRERAAHYSSAMSPQELVTGTFGLRITVHSSHELPALPAAVEVAVYRIVQEVLATVARHAQARTCTVQLSLQEGRLQVEITEDGTGLDTDRRAGVGLVSMRERAAE